MDSEGDTIRLLRVCPAAVDGDKTPVPLVFPGIRVGKVHNSEGDIVFYCSSSGTVRRCTGEVVGTACGGGKTILVNSNNLWSPCTCIISKHFHDCILELRKIFIRCA